MLGAALTVSFSFEMVDDHPSSYPCDLDHGDISTTRQQAISQDKMTSKLTPIGLRRYIGRCGRDVSTS